MGCLHTWDFRAWGCSSPGTLPLRMTWAALAAAAGAATAAPFPALTPAPVLASAGSRSPSHLWYTDWLHKYCHLTSGSNHWGTPTECTVEAVLASAMWYSALR